MLKEEDGQFSMFMSENTVQWLTLLTRQLQRRRVIMMTRHRNIDRSICSHPATQALLWLTGPLPTNNQKVRQAMVKI